MLQRHASIAAPGDHSRTLHANTAPGLKQRGRESVPVSLDTLRSADYTLAVRTDPADGDSTIFCGQIGHATTAGT